MAYGVLMMLSSGKCRKDNTALITPFFSNNVCHAKVRSKKFIHIGKMKIKTIKLDWFTFLLDNIIDKINIMYHGNFTEADRVIVETIYEAMKKEEKKLSKQAKNSDVNMFAQNIFPKIFEKIAQACYVQQMDSFAKLFEEQSFYNRVMEERGKAMYFNLKNGQ